MEDRMDCKGLKITLVVDENEFRKTAENAINKGVLDEKINVRFSYKKSGIILEGLVKRRAFKKALSIADTAEYGSNIVIQAQPAGFKDRILILESIGIAAQPKKNPDEKQDAPKKSPKIEVNFMPVASATPDGQVKIRR